VEPLAPLEEMEITKTNSKLPYKDVLDEGHDQDQFLKVQWKGASKRFESSLTYKLCLDAEKELNVNGCQEFKLGTNFEDDRSL
jgi:hypothetical protein